MVQRMSPFLCKVIAVQICKRQQVIIAERSRDRIRKARYRDIEVHQVLGCSGKCTSTLHRYCLPEQGMMPARTKQK